MIKRILVALDPDSDTPVATQYATDIARRYDAEVTGLAVVDMGSIEASTKGGGIGSMYYAEKLRKNLTEEVRAKARALVEEFHQAMADSGVRYSEEVQEGVPYRRIVEDMKYHDLLVVGKDPHFFYMHPDKETKTLDRVVKETIAPTLVVGDAYRKVNRVLIAFDGSAAASRAVRRFVHLQPFGTEVRVEVLHIHGKGGETDAELTLRLVRDYLVSHGFQAQGTNRKGDHPAQLIIDYAVEYGADLLLAGAHSVSKLREVAFGSTTSALIKNAPVPLWIDN